MKTFKLSDHLGSTRTEITEGGATASWDYEPYGDPVAGTAPRKGFIDREEDLENGLGDFGVRKYDSETGRFLSGDPLWEISFSLLSRIAAAMSEGNKGNDRSNCPPFLLLLITLPLLLTGLLSCAGEQEGANHDPLDSAALVGDRIDSILDRHPDLTPAERSFMSDYLSINQQFLDNDDVVDRLRADTACRCLLDISSCLPLIRSNPRSVMNADDHCVLAVVDSLVARVAAGEEEAWRAFEAFTITSDGYVAEYVWSVVIELFKENGEQLIGFLAGSDRSVERNVEEVLIQSIRSEFDYSPEPLERGTLIRRRTADSILTALASSATNDAERDVVRRVRSGIFPE